ncbi:AmmeMemoRadiSam system protein A [Candidatus Xianfuyuplasma coldseepsis]|nr:AmmeMemoRadiSam system protein A [Xianfuyuplasma coldseepsis]
MILKAYTVPHPPIIIPEIGRGEERKIQATIDAYHAIAKEIRDLQPDTIIISSPHSTVYSNYFHISPHSKASGSFISFGFPTISTNVSYDTTLVQRIEELAILSDIPAGTQGERDNQLDHGVLVPLYFINQYYSDYKLVRIGPSGLSSQEHYRLGQTIQKALDSDKKVIYIASGDLSHKLKKDGPYGFVKEGPIFDREIVSILNEANFLKLLSLDSTLCHKAAECGYGSFNIMAGVLDGYDVISNVYSYEGPFGVGYVVAGFTPTSPNINRHFLSQYNESLQEGQRSIRNHEDEYVTLARQSLEYYINHHKPLPRPKNLSKELTSSKAGVFVSLHKNGRLRGCIGTTGPTTICIADEIIHNAISAGTRDPRFPKVTAKELPDIIYSVDVLFPPEAITSINDLDPKRYGVIVKSGYKSGLLLPNLNGVDTAEEQVDIARQKAGIHKKDNYTLKRFEVIRHH